MAFYINERALPLVPTSFGGSQEKKRRAGTENVPAAVGFAKAVEIAQQEMESKKEKFKNYRELFIQELNNEKISFEVNGNQEHTLQHVLNISFKGMEVESFLVNLDMSGVYASSGSACTAGSIDPSHVLVAMFGKDADELRNSIRFSFGLGLTEEQIIEAAKRTAKIVKRLAN